jgi:Cu(I)/Ag(I) efflux system membrane fusion protein
MKPKQKTIAAIVVVLALAGAAYTAINSFNAASPSSVEAEVYTCPMHPSVRSDRPGACPVCGMALVRKTEGAPLPEHINALSISPTERVVANISTVPVLRGSVEKELRVVGLVSFAEPLQSTVAARFRGRIEVLHADFTGRTVGQNEPLFDLYSPDLIAAQREFLLALGNQDGQGLLTSSGMNRELLTAARERLIVHFGLTPEQISRLEASGEVRNTVTFHSPISGTVIRKTVVEGQYVDEGMTLYELADLSMVWIIFDVYEKDLPFVRNGQPMSIVSEAYPGQMLSGKITFVDPVLNPETRTVRIRTEMMNQDGKLKPNMYVTGLVKRKRTEVLVVPRSSILSTGQRTVVWVEVGENTFEPRDVVVGLTGDSSAEVLDGLGEGEVIASTGGYLIDSESSLRSPSPAASGHSDHGSVMKEDTGQGAEPDIHIRVAGGYSPKVIHVRKGVLTRLHFLREESSRCTEEVVLRDFGLRASLPQGVPVTLEITPEETGEFVFSCGMNMIHGKIVVHE